jgi:hypothetical protein
MAVLREWHQQHSLVVRDLLDAADLEHPPLRVKCSRHGEATIDRLTLLGEMVRRRREHDSGDPICVSLATVAVTVV